MKYISGVGSIPLLHNLPILGCDKELPVVLSGDYTFIKQAKSLK